MPGRIMTGRTNRKLSQMDKAVIKPRRKLLPICATASLTAVPVKDPKRKVNRDWRGETQQAIPKTVICRMIHAIAVL